MFADVKTLQANTCNTPMDNMSYLFDKNINLIQPVTNLLFAAITDRMVRRVVLNETVNCRRRDNNAKLTYRNPQTSLLVCKATYTTFDQQLDTGDM